MRVVDLKDTAKSTWVKENIFPDGQVGYQITDLSDRSLVRQVVIYASLTAPGRIPRLTLLLDCVLRHYRNARVEVRIGYLWGGRSDREFGLGGVPAFAVGRMITSVLEHKDIARVHFSFLDPHSRAALAGFDPVSTSIVYHRGILSGLPAKPVIVIPDAGARERVAKQLGLTPLPVVEMQKSRMEEGVRISPSMYAATFFYGGDRTAVIIDDLCDGGRTFVEIARQVRALGAKDVELRVTHGVFSQGVPTLFAAGIGLIRATNSYTEDTTGIDWRRAWPDFVPPPWG